ncbi:hypothetical protein CsSME_00020688 [Camellia sinensis var. sinensis]
MLTRLVVLVIDILPWDFASCPNLSKLLVGLPPFSLRRADKCEPTATSGISHGLIDASKSKVLRSPTSANRVAN